MKRKILVAIFGLMFTTIVSSQASLMLPGSDDQYAVKRLYEWISNRGETISISKSGNYLIYKDDFTISIYPRTSEEGLDRLIIYSYFSAADSYRGTEILLNAINKLNNNWNIGSFYMDEDGDLSVRTQITFVDYLDFIELKQFFKWFNKAIYNTLTSETIKNYLK